MRFSYNNFIKKNRNQISQHAIQVPNIDSAKF